MKTLKDIIFMVEAESCSIMDSCFDCPMGDYCWVDIKLLTLDYLYWGEYYGEENKKGPYI